MNNTKHEPLGNIATLLTTALITIIICL